MMHDAQVNLAGYVATEPKFRKVAGDTSSTKLRVAYTSRRRDRETGEWTDGPTSFVNIQCWRTLADNVAMSVRKGEPVLVMGRLQVRRFEDAEGNPRTAVEIEATSVGHDLTRGVAKFARTKWASTVDDIAAPDGAPGPGDGAGSRDGAGAGPGAEPASGPASGEPSAVSGAAPHADGVIDETAVAEFARELGESLGAGATVGTDGEDADVPVDAAAGAAVPV
jgi:single-strand DNA-binding protein